MKYLFLGFVTIILFFGCKKENVRTNMGASSQTENANNSYKLVWSDEFDYTGLPDSTKWNYESGHVRNNETQYYEVARLKNSQVKNGHLIITARNDNYHHHGITSASIITKGKMQFLYGKIVVRAKMPVGNGAWSAIWTAGINRDTVHWPLCGEIDILEWVGRGPQYILGSMYMPNYNGTTDTSSVTIYNTGDSSLSSKFHTYALEWDSSQLKYYYDNYNYATYKASDLTPEKWLPFTKPHFLLLNLAMGGESGGVIDETKFPFTYQVDYVRYYQKK